MTTTAPLAAALNPADKKDHLLFNISPNGDLELSDRRLRGPDDDDTPQPKNYTAMEKEATGMIANPSSIAAFDHKKKIEVWGISKATGLVVRLSPAIRYLVDANTTGNTAAVAGTSTGSTAYIYYLTAAPPSKTTALGEYQVGTGPLKKLYQYEPLKSTSLCAIYTGKQRVLFWQDSAKFLHATDPEGPNDTTIQSTSSAKEGSALAAAWEPTTQTAYLYYINGGDGTIWKTTRASATGGVNWSGVSQVKNDSLTPVVDSFSGLAVTVTPTYNLLSFVSRASGEAKYEEFRDPLPVPAA